MSVLKATGLIEAEIHALESTGQYAPSQVATVTCITEEGMVELAHWIYERGPMPEHKL
ncbi:hypothetical protein [Variovorax sp. RKNM96]|uniref:hypothetical protein n=1 Tax=Variovorax sp. RKNM96 TaxID=2681552 RepID=UPI001F125F78|nr:hypothetical protein [Variovorax sp. RKNM96]